MSAFFYYLGAAADSALSVFGIRTPYEQPPYTVVGEMTHGVQIRDYGPRVAVETAMRGGNDGAAFGRLFRYIAGANAAHDHIHMTVPVQEASRVGAEAAQDPEVMRFFLPQSVVAAGPPVPKDAAVRIVTVPPQRMAVLRFSGSLDDASRRDHAARLLAAVAASGQHAAGEPSLFSYDPPFTLPFLRRNEVAVRLDAAPQAAPAGVATTPG